MEQFINFILNAPERDRPFVICLIVIAGLVYAVRTLWKRCEKLEAELDENAELQRQLLKIWSHGGSDDRIVKKILEKPETRKMPEAAEPRDNS